MLFIFNCWCSWFYFFITNIWKKYSPKIKVDEQIYWNLQTNKFSYKWWLWVLNHYEFTFIDGDKEVKLDSKVYKVENGTLNLEVIPPMFDEVYKPTQGILQVKTTDNSLWNFFNGNMCSKKF